MVSIIIVTYNGKPETLDCLKSLYEAGWGPDLRKCEIIVVDNASTDGVADAISKEYPDVILIRNHDNKYFANANNQGAKIARGEYLLLLNSDTVVLQGELDKLLEFLNGAPEKIACVGPIVLNRNKTIQSMGFPLDGYVVRFLLQTHFYKLIPDAIIVKIFRPGIPLRKVRTRRVGWISGCCMLIRKEIYVSLGGLNPTVGFYGEEPEFCFKLEKNGYESWVYADSTIVHLGGISTKGETLHELKNESIRFRNYTALVEATYGLEQGIRYFKWGLFLLYVKYVFYFLICNAKKNYLSEFIPSEKRLLEYMKCQNASSKKGQ